MLSNNAKIKDEQNKDEKDTINNADEKLNLEKRHTPKHAVKYVFFNAQTGEVEFQYGGFKDKPYELKNKNRETIAIYELGLLIKDCPTHENKTELVFFFAGDFMDKEIKINMPLMNWAVATVEISIQ